MILYFKWPPHRTTPNRYETCRGFLSFYEDFTFPSCSVDFQWLVKSAPWFYGQIVYRAAKLYDMIQQCHKQLFWRISDNIPCIQWTLQGVSLQYGRRFYFRILIIVKVILTKFATVSVYFLVRYVTVSWEGYISKLIDNIYNSTSGNSIYFY